MGERYSLTYKTLLIRTSQSDTVARSLTYKIPFRMICIILLLRVVPLNSVAQELTYEILLPGDLHLNRITEALVCEGPLARSLHMKALKEDHTYNVLINEVF